MYAPSPDALTLRQGDICEVEHFPVWDLGSASSVSGALEGSLVLPTWKSIVRSAKSSKCLVAVASQCCDLENPEKGNRSGVLLAPLRTVPAGPREDRYATIMSSNVLNEDREYAFLQLFPLTLGDGRDSVIDMSALTTMAPPQRAVTELLASRVWTLDEDVRGQFRMKLAYMLGREPDAVDARA